jgi:hypothetical protein
MYKSYFEKDNWLWKLDLIKQQILEWWELQLYNFKDLVPDSSLWNWLKSISWLIVILLVIWLLWRLWLVLYPFIYNSIAPFRQSIKQELERQNKPRSLTDWLTKSQQFQRQGNYRQACFCLYQAMLQKLNDSNIILHQSSRTDGEYLQLVRGLSKPRPYQILLMTHQRLCFSKTEASLSTFEECQQAYRDIEIE